MAIKPELKAFIPAAKAIAAVMHPHAEVVIHDVAKNKVAAIFNNYSKREVGDCSYLGKEEEFAEDVDVIGPYEKMNWNGNRLKSISAAIRNHEGKVIGLLCINIDMAKFAQLQQLLNNFVNFNTNVSHTEILFKDDWQEKISQFIQNYLQAKNCSIDSLSKDQRIHLIAALQKEGAFKGKNTANYVAKILGVSRATIYNLLRDVVKI